VNHVEGVVIALARAQLHHTRLLQQILDGHTSNNLPLRVKLNLQVFTEARRVVVPDRLGVSERLENRAGAEQQLLLTDRTV